MWSIGTELQLYAVYPLLLLIMGRFGWRNGLIATLAFEIFSKTILNAIPEHQQSLPIFALSNSPFAYWFSWAIGAYVAENATTKRRESLGWVDLRCLIFFILASFLFAPLASVSFPLVAFTTAVAIDRFIVSRWHPVNFPIAGVFWRHLTWLGIISYSVYLIHQPVLTQSWYLLEKLGLRQSAPLMTMIICLLLYPLIVAASYGLYRMIELPFIRLGSRLLRHRKSHLA
jgi:peptidoglycan/LPS O-acetylase OafA/YrhL